MAKDKDKIPPGQAKKDELPSDTKYPEQPSAPPAQVPVGEPRLPNGAPREVPGIHNDRFPLPNDPNAQTPTPAPGQPAI